MFIFNEMMMKSALFSGLEPTIYHTRGEHANHYATDTVHNGLNFRPKKSI